jgi:hypothetical protein
MVAGDWAARLGPVAQPVQLQHNAYTVFVRVEEFLSST